MTTALNITVIGKEELVARLDAMPTDVHRAIFASITKLSLDLENYVKTQKLSGQVLNKITGRLQSSIHSDVRDSGATITGRVFSAVPMPYARIHEYGGKTRAHVIEAVRGKALAFMKNGKLVFAKRVNHPGSVMPERSFLRSSLADFKDRITAALQQAVAKGIGK